MRISPRWTRTTTRCDVAKYVGLDLTDIPACYRHRAQQIADGKRQRPVTALNIEFMEDGTPTLILFGATEDMTERERVALLVDSISVLSTAAAACNAGAAD